MRESKRPGARRLHASHVARRGKAERRTRVECGTAARGPGLRRDDSLNRAFTPTVAWDHKRKLIKISPIAPWTDDDIERYLNENPDVISNPLLQLDYRSIGCEPCTQPVKQGEDARAGRWAGMAKTECGIHI